MSTLELWLAAGSMPGLWLGGWLPEELAGVVAVASALLVPLQRDAARCEQHDAASFTQQHGLE